MRYHNYKKHITKLLLLTGSLFISIFMNFLDITDNYFSDEISSDSYICKQSKHNRIYMGYIKKCSLMKVI